MTDADLGEIPRELPPVVPLEVGLGDPVAAEEVSRGSEGVEFPPVGTELLHGLFRDHFPGSTHGEVRSDPSSDVGVAVLVDSPDEPVVVADGDLLDRVREVVHGDPRGGHPGPRFPGVDAESKVRDSSTVHRPHCSLPADNVLEFPLVELGAELDVVPGYPLWYGGRHPLSGPQLVVGHDPQRRGRYGHILDGVGTLDADKLVLWSYAVELSVVPHHPEPRAPAAEPGPGCQLEHPVLRGRAVVVPRGGPPAGVQLAPALQDTHAGFVRGGDC